MTKGTLIKKKKISGFRNRMKTKSGQRIIKAKRKKKRKTIAI